MALTQAIVAIIILNVVNCNKEAFQATLNNIPEDGHLDVLGLAKKFNYSAESFNITTKDGYISEMFYIPGKKNKHVLILHGIFGSAADLLLRGNQSLGIMMAKEGYDTWLINFRGNRYARKHVTLDPDKDPKFWDYTGHEFGMYDLPAAIDHILNVTGEKKVSIIGFSEGTTSTLVLGSMLAEYNDKVNMFIAMAPVAYLHNVKPGLSDIVWWSPFLNMILPSGYVEVAGYYSLTKAILNLLCTQLVIGYELCYQGGINFLSGADTAGIDREFFKTILGHVPSGTSRKNLIHLSQISLGKKFCMFDYGTTKNLLKYGSFTPPEYDLSKVTMKTVLVVAKNDPVSTIEDVNLLREKLPNVVKYIEIEKPNYYHLDHLWSKDAWDIEYPKIIDILNEI